MPVIPYSLMEWTSILPSCRNPFFRPRSLRRYGRSCNPFPHNHCPLPHLADSGLRAMLVKNQPRGGFFPEKGGTFTGVLSFQFAVSYCLVDVVIGGPTEGTG